VRKQSGSIIITQRANSRESATILHEKEKESMERTWSFAACVARRAVDADSALFKKKADPPWS
jgi:hypothetical protein|tara:strand:- start:557 stop:745 length:189 start_codon:yes stop_codon:yes gene_type:complete